MRLGRYELLGEIARGGMGVVFQGRADDGKTVAIKLLLSAGLERDARFERERRLVASFGEDEGFVPLLDVGDAPQGAFYVMPLVEGGTLKDRLQHGPLDVADAFDLGIALASALGKAHERGIVHRDLKPANVLFTRDGRPLIADLGLAKHFRRDVSGGSQSLSLSAHGQAVGTIGYMPPEQMNGSEVGPGADAFALGAILYECLSGQAAFAGDSVLEVASHVADGRFEPLLEVRPETPRGLARVVERCLAPDPARRFPDGHAVRRALEAGESARRRRPLVLGGVALVGLAALGAVLAVRRAAGPASPVETPGRKSSLAAAKPAPPASGARAAYAEGEALLAANDVDGAIAAYTRAIAANDRRADAWAGRASARGRKGDLEGAIADASRAIELDPKCSVAYNARGAATVALERDVASALADFTRAIELDPTYSKAHANRGVLRSRNGDVRGGLADVTRAIELEPGASLLANRGSIRAEAGDVPGAMADFAKAIELEPANARVYFNRAIVRQQQLHDLPGAEADFDRAVTLDPTSAEAWRGRSDVRRKRGNLQGAIDDATRSITLSPRLAAAWHSRALTRMADRDLRGALADEDATIELDTRNPEVFHERAKLRRELGDVAGALADCERAVELAPGNASYLGQRAMLHAERHEHDLAIADATRALEAAPDYAPALLTRGLSRHERGEDVSAAADIREFLRRVPDDARARQVRELLTRIEASKR